MLDYDLLLLNVCHFHHHHHTFLSIYRDTRGICGCLPYFLSETGMNGDITANSDYLGLKWTAKNYDKCLTIISTSNRYLLFTFRQNSWLLLPNRLPCLWHINDFSSSMRLSTVFLCSISWKNMNMTHIHLLILNLFSHKLIFILSHPNYNQIVTKNPTTRTIA